MADAQQGAFTYSQVSNRRRGFALMYTFDASCFWGSLHKPCLVSGLVACTLDLRIFQVLRSTEIDELDHTLLHHHILCFQVTVHNPRLSQVCHCAEELREPVPCHTITAADGLHLGADITRIEMVQRDVGPEDPALVSGVSLIRTLRIHITGQGKVNCWKQN